MKKSILIMAILLIAMLVFASACSNTKNNTATPKPNLTAMPNTTTPAVTAPGTPRVTGPIEGLIEGFVEGESLDINELPEKITKAIKDEYPKATIKGASYATYLDEQMYLLKLEGEGVPAEIYAKADGTLMPYGMGNNTANPSISPESTGSSK